MTPLKRTIGPYESQAARDSDARCEPNDFTVVECQEIDELHARWLELLPAVREADRITARLREFGLKPKRDLL